MLYKPKPVPQNSDEEVDFMKQNIHTESNKRINAYEK